MHETPATLTTDELLIALCEMPYHTKYSTVVTLPIFGKVAIAVCMCDCHREEQGIMYESIADSDIGPAQSHAATDTGFLLALGGMGVREGARWMPFMAGTDAAKGE